MGKIWNKQDPEETGSYICRMLNAYIKMCFWDGSKWLDMWKSTLEGDVAEWIKIPYESETPEKEIKEIKDMTTDEVRREMDELWAYLYMTKSTGTYDKFSWNGLDYWDASRRHHRLSEDFFMQNMRDR